MLQRVARMNGATLPVGRLAGMTEYAGREVFSATESSRVDVTPVGDYGSTAVASRSGSTTAVAPRSVTAKGDVNAESPRVGGLAAAAVAVAGGGTPNLRVKEPDTMEVLRIILSPHYRRTTLLL